MKQGFDNAAYLKIQYEHILERVEMFSKLYLEFGGKLFEDLHAARVLPGYNPNAKMMLLEKFKDKAEIIICINAGDIQNKKQRNDLGILYTDEVLRLEDIFRKRGLTVSNIVITQFKGEPLALEFKEKLQAMGKRVFVHRPIANYPANAEYIVSDQGFGANEYMPTEKPLVIVTAPGPGSGKMATCLNELYHEYKMGNSAGYAKFESFPVWNLPLDHPVNIAYEAATLELKDQNMIDGFHYNKYGVVTVNYNRDISIFPVVRTMLEKITGRDDIYFSPTDMGVNMIRSAIIDDEVVRKAACEEIVRRYYNALYDHAHGKCDESLVNNAIVLMNKAGIDVNARAVVTAADEKQRKKNCPAVAIRLPDGTIITGRDNRAMNASASAVFNAVKYLAGIDDKVKLLAPEMIEPILNLKRNVFKYRRKFLTLEEALIVLAYSSSSGDETLKSAMACLSKLSGSDAHSTVMLADHERRSFRQLGITVTCDSVAPDFDKILY